MRERQTIYFAIKIHYGLFSYHDKHIKMLQMNYD